VGRVSHDPDRLSVVVDDRGLVAIAGLIFVATSTARVGLRGPDPVGESSAEPRCRDRVQVLTGRS
jgi:hypothetical protein